MKLLRQQLDVIWGNVSGRAFEIDVWSYITSPASMVNEITIIKYIPVKTCPLGNT